MLNAGKDVDRNSCVAKMWSGYIEWFGSVLSHIFVCAAPTVVCMLVITIWRFVYH